MIDGRENPKVDRSAANIAFLCNRHLGIGADGLIILEESDTFDFRMEYFNSDGKPGSMCGNGGRCTMAFAVSSGMVKENAKFLASDGSHEASILASGEVRISLNDVTDFQYIEGGIYLNTGSPHLVIFEKNIEEIDVLKEGAKLRHSPSFPEGCNVNFVEIKPDHIRVRTFERGVEAETLSCGTGVTAAAIATFIHTGSSKTVTDVSTPGGKLKVEFDYNQKEKSFSNIFLSGPVKNVFQGTIEL